MRLVIRATAILLSFTIQSAYAATWYFVDENANGVVFSDGESASIRGGKAIAWEQVILKKDLEGVHSFKTRSVYDCSEGAITTTQLESFDAQGKFIQIDTTRRPSEYVAPDSLQSEAMKFACEGKHRDRPVGDPHAFFSEVYGTQ